MWFCIVNGGGACLNDDECVQMPTNDDDEEPIRRTQFRSHI